MFFRKKYSLLLNQNKDILTKTLKAEQNKKHVLPTTFSESVYELKLDYNEWIVSYKHNILRGLKIKPDAYIQLTNISEKMTEMNVTFKLSPIWILAGVFMQLALIASWFLPHNTHITFMGNNLGADWLNRIAIVLCNIALFNGVIWITFLIETTRLKKVIEKLFGTGQVV